MVLAREGSVGGLSEILEAENEVAIRLSDPNSLAQLEKRLGEEFIGGLKSSGLIQYVDRAYLSKSVVSGMFVYDVVAVVSEQDGGVPNGIMGVSDGILKQFFQAEQNLMTKRFVFPQEWNLPAGISLNTCRNLHVCFYYFPVPDLDIERVSKTFPLSPGKQIATWQIYGK